MHTRLSSASVVLLAVAAVGFSRQVGVERRYAASRMYGAAGAFAGANVTQYLRQRRPQLLRFEHEKPRLLDLELGPIVGPASLGLPARDREMGIFNPALVPAPPKLCPKCAYVVALRVDPLHQCHESSPLLKTEPGMPKGVAANAWFKGTAIAVLDAKLNVLGWTWLLNAPQHQVTYQKAPISRWFVPAGSSDVFPPPWGKAVYDVRLENLDGHLFVTYVCRRCAFSVALLQLTGESTPAGGITRLRAWQNRRFSSTESWAQGRNQALFVASRAPGLPSELMVQPWLSLVGSFGAPAFASESALCGSGGGGGTRLCGATPAGTRLAHSAIVNERRGKAGGGFGRLELLANASRRELSRSSVGGFRLSTTSNLLRVTRGRSGRRCDVYIGVGHVHRAEGGLNRIFDEPGARRLRRKNRRAKKLGEALQGLGGNGTRLDATATTAASSSASSSTSAAAADASNATSRPFMWGYHYTHFLYAMQAYPPFRVLATSGEFCLQSAQDATDCESIQFVSGIAWAADAPTTVRTLLLTYGVNDCEAKVGRMPLARAWELLLPLEGEGGLSSPDVCDAPSPAARRSFPPPKPTESAESVDAHLREAGRPWG